MTKIKQQIDYVVKLGGSIAEKGTVKQIESLCNKLMESYSKKKNFVIVPGGGPFAEEVRRMQQEFQINDELAHWMAIHSMEQYRLLLQHFLPNSTVLEYNGKDFPDTLHEYLAEKIPIISVFNFMKTESKLPHNWDSTSDAIATEIATKLGIPSIVFVKDIDGVMVDNQLVTQISIQDFMKLSNSPLDRNTPVLLKEHSLLAYIINGFKPERMVDLLVYEKEIIGTKIVL